MQAASTRARGIALLGLGLSLVPICAFASAAWIPWPEDLDGYLPAVLGGLVGAGIGFVCVGLGVARLVAARRESKLRDALAD